MGAAFLWNGDRTWVQIQVVVPAGLPCRDMCVAVKEDVSGLQGRKGILMEVMAMGGVDHPVPNIEDSVIRQNGKLKDHLVHFCVAVPPDAENGGFSFIQQCQDFFGGVVFRQVISGAVVENVPQEDQSVRLFPVPGFEHFLTVIAGTMDI